MYMKDLKIISITFLLLIGLVLISCKSNSVQPKEDTNSYKSVVFIVPGQVDDGIDLLAQGGILIIDFIGNDSVRGHLKIPANSGSIYHETDTNFIGEYIQNSDTIRFVNTGTFFDLYLPFFMHADTLETPPDFSPRGYLRIILIKQ